MNRLDPAAVFDNLAFDIPAQLRGNLIVTGSLAAAYHFRTQLHGRAINTKDADLVIHPAGNRTTCREIAAEMLAAGWRRTQECFASPQPEPADRLRAIRLFPPASTQYFVEFLNVPDEDQVAAKSRHSVRLDDGWYGLPSFRFLGVVAIGRLQSDSGLEFAAPSMMALANLLSHPQVGSQRIETGAMLGVLRAAKDLGRVLALAHLAGRDVAESWQIEWSNAVKSCFPAHWPNLLRNLGAGLAELIQDPNALRDAQTTTDIGLLNGLNVSEDQLRAIGERLLVDAIEPVRVAARA